MPKIIKLTGIVGYDITAEKLENRLPRNGEKAVIKVDSVGGSVFEGNRLYNLFIDHLNKFPGSLTVELGAIAASAASYFPLAVGAKNIKVRENTTFMGHKAWSFAIGNADEMKAEAEILDGFDKIIAKVYSKVTGKTVDESLEDMKNEFWLIGGQSVVDSGFASGIVKDDETETEDIENEIIDKSEILAKMKEAKNKLRDIENTEDLNKWAARIHETLNSTDIEDDGQKLLFDVPNPDQSGKNNSVEDYMDLKDFLDKNPEAKIDVDKMVNDIVDDRVKDAVAEDRERSAELLTLSGLKIPDNILDSVKKGDTVGDFAKAELKARNEKVNAVTKEEQNLGGLSNEGQEPKNVEGAEKSKTEKTVDDVLDKMLGKKKEGDK